MVLPYDTSWDDVKLKVRQAYTNPNVGKIVQVELKSGPRTFRLATLLEIMDPTTKQLHHYSLKIDHIDRTKRRGWFADAERSVRLEGDSPDEIARLYAFLHSLYEGTLIASSGDLHLIRSEDYAKLEKVLEAIPNLPSADRLELVKTVLAQMEHSPSYAAEFVAAFETSNPETLRHISVASRMVEYKKAYHKLKTMVETGESSEYKLQVHLKENPWMFGSEYSELLNRRNWTRDDSVDYMLRRTVDNYLEIVEIKTPFSDNLFIHDPSHDCYYPSAKLSPVLGQVIRYVEEVDRDRNSIISRDTEDPLKVRARIIIGRDGPAEHTHALRNLNGHLHRIEVLTFDQLLRIASRVLQVFHQESTTGTSDSPHDDQPPI